MTFPEQIRKLREKRLLLQRQVSASLDMDNALYCKIERGDRVAKREQVVALAKIFSTDESELLTLWLADRIDTLVNGEDAIAEKALTMVLNKKKK